MRQHNRMPRCVMQRCLEPKARQLVTEPRRRTPAIRSMGWLRADAGDAQRFEPTLTRLIEGGFDMGQDCCRCHRSMMTLAGACG
jgi:hypothetical protein